MGNQYNFVWIFKNIQLTVPPPARIIELVYWCFELPFSAKLDLTWTINRIFCVPKSPLRKVSNRVMHNNYYWYWWNSPYLISGWMLQLTGRHRRNELGRCLESDQRKTVTPRTQQIAYLLYFTVDITAHTQNIFHVSMIRTTFSELD